MDVLLTQVSLFSPLDGGAVVWLLAAWLGIGWLIERDNPKRLSTSALMQRYRHAWMDVCLSRDPRILDGNILSTLRQGTSFFASASMIAIGGGLALLGNTEQLRGVAQDLVLGDAPAVVWEVKLILVLLLLVNAFLKFVWAHRLFGYAAVVMAAIPNDPGAPQARQRAYQAADLNNAAARSFNRGLRSIYFALGALAWLLGAAALILATCTTVWVLYRREFASHSRRSLLTNIPEVSGGGD